MTEGQRHQASIIIDALRTMNDLNSTLDQRQTLVKKLVELITE